MTTPWKQRQQIPDLQILDSADQFKAAWDILKIQPPGSGVVLPQINAVAIAIELYLKSLSADIVHTPDITLGNVSQVTAKPQIFGHKLTEIFDNIAPDIQRGIELAFLSKESVTRRTFRDAVNALEGAFSDSRYPFESGKDISEYRLRDFELVVQCLHDFVSTLEVREIIK